MTVGVVSSSTDMRLRVARYRFKFVATTPLRLPAYLGSTLRGAFGHTFRRLVCATRQPTCDGCPIHSQCAYPAIFEPSPDASSERLRNLQEIPRPFVMVPPLWCAQGDRRSGEALEFAVSLFGDAVSYLPWFLLSIREMGRGGFGRDRHMGFGRCELAEVWAEGMGLNEDVCIYRAEEGKVHQADRALELTQLVGARGSWDEKANRLQVSFVTPFRAQQNGNLVRRIDFYILLRSVLSRLSTLSYFYGGKQDLALDFRGMLDRAREVRVAEDRTRWVEWDRYSSRQDKHMLFGGLVGQAVFEGPLGEFVPYLVAGEYLHVGKATVFGLGQYGVEP